MQTLHKAIEFLNLVYLDRPWCLTAIHPDTKAIETRTFRKETIAACDEWLREYDGIRNLYWSVNPPNKDMDKKTAKQDMASMNFFHVDVDPGEFQDLKQQQDDILKKMTINLPKGIPEPTLVIFSGGGFQAFWKLKEPLVTNGDPIKIADAERYNIALARRFGADNCHDITRIMRLPYTMNMPDAKKLAKGRAKVMAAVVQHRPELTYEAESFEQAESTTEARMPVADLKLGSNVRRLGDVTELNEWKVDDRVKVIIVQGTHPDQSEIAKKVSKTGKTPSRSEWLFDVVCNLLRCGVPDEIIYGVITDPGFGISESVLELGRGAHRYAIKQIVSGKEYIIDPLLAEFNAKYAVVNYGSDTLVAQYDTEVEEGRVYKTVSFKSFEAFKKWTMDRKVQVGTTKEGNPVYMDAGKWWLSHPKRRKYEKVVFRPGAECPDNYLNLWQGWPFEPVPGDGHLGYKDHVRKIICNDDPVLFDYFWKWMARCVQTPMTRSEVALVLQGGKGTGKTWFAETFSKLFGQHGVTLGSSDQLYGRFNKLLALSSVAILDEATYAEDKKHQGIYKNLVTGGTIVCEEKFKDAVEVDNFTHIIIISNDDHVINASSDERRACVTRVNDERKDDHNHFGMLTMQMESGGYANLMHELLNLDLSGFNVRKYPDTEALQQQKALTRGPSALRDDIDEVLENIPFGCFRTKDLVAVVPNAGKARKGEINEILKQHGFEYMTVQPFDADGNREPINDYFTRRGYPPVRVEVVEVFRDLGMVPGKLTLPTYVPDAALDKLPIEKMWSDLKRVSKKTERTNQFTCNAVISPGTE